MADDFFDPFDSRGGTDNQSDFFDPFEAAATPTPGGDFSAGTGAGFESLYSLGNAFKAAFGDLIGNEQLVQEGLAASDAHEQAAQRFGVGRITRIEDVADFGDFIDYSQYTLGQLAPFALESAASAIAGAVVGSAAGGPGGAVAGGAYGALGRTGTKELIKRWVRGEVKDAAEAKLARDAVTKAFATGGAAAGSYPVGVGDVYRETVEAGDPNAEAAFALGIPYAALDVVPEAAGIGRLLKGGRGGLVGRVAKGAVEQAPMEALSEYGQEEILLQTRGQIEPGYDIYGPEAWSRRLNAAIAGGLGGAAFGGVTGVNRQGGVAQLPAPPPGGSQTLPPPRQFNPTHRLPDGTPVVQATEGGTPVPDLYMTEDGRLVEAPDALPAPVDLKKPPPQPVPPKLGPAPVGPATNVPRGTPQPTSILGGGAEILEGASQTLAELSKDQILEPRSALHARAMRDRARQAQQDAALAGQPVPLLGSTQQRQDTGTRSEQGGNVPVTQQVPAGQLYIEYGNQKYPVESLEDASNKWRQYIAQTGLGASQLGDKVYITDTQGAKVAEVAYNGRIVPLNTPTTETGTTAEQAPQTAEKPENVAPDATAGRPGTALTPATPKALIPVSKRQLDQAANEAATSPQNERPEPTDAQKEAGNYKKGHVNISGLDIMIENPAGSRRNPKWPPLKNHYGYIRRTEGYDGDEVDVFLGPEATEGVKKVHIVYQKDPKTGKFDEHKVMVGFPSTEAAKEAYLSNYSKGWQGLGEIAEYTIDEFKKWLKLGRARNSTAARMGEEPAIAEPEPPAETEEPGKESGEKKKPVEKVPLSEILITQDVIIEGTGEKGQIKVPANEAIEEAHNRLSALEQLKWCLSA